MGKKGRLEKARRNAAKIPPKNPEPQPGKEAVDLKKHKTDQLQVYSISKEIISGQIDDVRESCSKDINELAELIKEEALAMAEIRRSEEALGRVEDKKVVLKDDEDSDSENPAGGILAPKVRPNDNYQPSRINEPYHPSHPYNAAPLTQREITETAGSSEYTSEGRAVEERNRKDSVELMRKEQQKSFQEKQMLKPEKNKGDFDFSTLLDDDSQDEKRLLPRSSEIEEPLTPPVSNNDAEKSTSLTSRPLVPPGFTGTVLERKLGTKSLNHPHQVEVGNSGLEDDILQGQGNRVLNGTSDNRGEKQPVEQMVLRKQHHASDRDNDAQSHKDSGSSPSTSGNSRPRPGRWESRSSGRSDQDIETQSDKDSELASGVMGSQEGLPHAGQSGFDAHHHPMLQQMHMAGNFPPPHLLQGLSSAPALPPLPNSGAPLPAHLNRQVSSFMEELNPMPGFHFGPQPANFGGLGMPLPAPDVAGGSNHPEALQRLLHGNEVKPEKIHPFAAGDGHNNSQGM